MSEDVPWVGLRRSAAACGIDDRAFWRMSPRALIAITAGMNRGAGGRTARLRRGKGGAEPLPYKGGGLCDCP